MNTKFDATTIVHDRRKTIAKLVAGWATKAGLFWQSWNQGFRREKAAGRKSGKNARIKTSSEKV
ncbi:hypothetical protein KJ068_00955 [bacterium]|nr:hypothetical protein [bacterium]